MELHLNPVCAKRLKQYTEYVKKDSVYMLTVCQGLFHIFTCTNLLNLHNLMKYVLLLLSLQLS